MSEAHRNLLLDLGDEIRRRALEAKTARDALDRGSNDYLFEAGRSQAYYEVVSLLVHSADIFEIPLHDLRLTGIQPDRDLL